MNLSDEEVIHPSIFLFLTSNQSLCKLTFQNNKLIWWCKESKSLPRSPQRTQYSASKIRISGYKESKVPQVHIILWLQLSQDIKLAVLESTNKEKLHPFPVITFRNVNIIDTLCYIIHMVIPYQMDQWELDSPLHIAFKCFS